MGAVGNEGKKITTSRRASKGELGVGGGGSMGDG
jgi:hypothetical protein